MPYCYGWAKVTPTTGSERFVSQQWVGTSSHLVQMRFVRGITPAMRVRYYSATPGDCLIRNRILRINSVQDFREEHVETIIACTEEEPARG